MGSRGVSEFKQHHLVLVMAIMRFECSLLHHGLAKPAFSKTDSSDLALKGYLSQLSNNGHFCPVAFYCRKLTPAEQNYKIYNKEMQVIVACLRKEQVYLKGA